MATICEMTMRDSRPTPLPKGRRSKSNFQVERRTPRILLAEDDLEMRQLLAGVLRSLGYEVTAAVSGMDALKHIGPSVYSGAEFEFDLIISDIRMPGIDGLELLAGLHLCEGAPPVILITAFGDFQTHHDAERLGAVVLLDKPFDIDEFCAVLRRVLPPPGETRKES